MKKKSILFLLALTVGIMAIGCGKKEEPASSNDTFVADEDEEEKEEEIRKKIRQHIVMLFI